MFKDKLKGKILVIFSDPGGAKPCLSICESIDTLDLLVISDREYVFYNDFKSKVKVIKRNKEIIKYIDEFKPDIVLTGTSYTSDIERKAIAHCKKIEIFTISFIDHWTSISDRFLTNERMNFPDEIWVLDERAKQIAIEEKIAKNKLFIAGNPYHVWLKNWKPKINRKQFYHNLHIDETKKMILFAPDPISNVNGIEKFGFDEFVASRKLIECIRETDKEFKDSYHFLIKMHPNQCVKKLVEIFKDNNNFTILPLEVDTNQSIYFADIVMGFFSSLLIEANIMNKPIIRFLDSQLANDPFKGLNIGVKANSGNLVDNIKYLNEY